MANNFRKTGAAYVSKSGGNDSWNGSADFPKASITSGISAAGIGQTVVVGSGAYSETFTMNRPILADGIVKLTTGTITVSGGLTYTGLYFDTITFVSSTSSTFTNCIFKSCTFSSSSPSHTFTNCILVDSDASNFTSANLISTGSIFINTNLSRVGTFRDSYTNAATIIACNPAVSASHNNIMGGVKINTASTVTTGVIQDTTGNYYDLSIAGTGGTGTIGDPYYRGNTNGAIFDLANQRIAYPTVNTSSFNSSPKFNNSAKMDFTLMPDSPHINAAQSGLSNIGGTAVASSYYAGVSDELLTANGAVISGLSGTTDLEVVSTTGYIRSTPIFIAVNTQKFAITRHGNLAFDKSQTPGGSLNKNVPDALVYKSIVLSGTRTSGSPVITGLSSTTDLAVGQAVSGTGIPNNTAILTVDSASQVTLTANATSSGTNDLTFVPKGSIPDRLVFKMRWADLDDEPTVDAEWNNGGLLTAGDFGYFLYKDQQGTSFHQVDTNGFTEGQPEFDPLLSQDIGAKWVQFEEIMTNDYTN